VKNKVAAPFRDAEVDILYGEGISREGDLLDLGAEQGVVEKSGAWFSFQGERLGQGRDNSRTFLRENPEVRERIDAAVRQKIGLPKPGSVPTPEFALASESVPAKPPTAETSRAAARTA
jgi:recombination protein RecA